MSGRKPLSFWEDAIGSCTLTFCGIIGAIWLLGKTLQLFGLIE